MLRLRGVSLVYGPPGAGKTTFAAWYTYHNYKGMFWVSVFEDEATFRRNKASFGYDFGGLCSGRRRWPSLRPFSARF